MSIQIRFQKGTVLIEEGDERWSIVKSKIRNWVQEHTRAMMLVYDGNYRSISVMEYEVDDGEGGRRRYGSGKMKDTEVCLRMVDGYKEEMLGQHIFILLL